MSGPRLTVVQLLPALSAGGAERSAVEIAAALVADGHRAIVISAGGRMVPELECIGAQHIKLPINRKSLWTLRHVWSLRRLLRRLDADIVHARSRLPAWLVWLALRGYGRDRPRFVTTVHGLNSPGFYSSIMTRGERAICVSDAVLAYVRQHYPRTPAQRLRVIPRGIDAKTFPSGFRASDEWKQAFHHEHPALRDRALLTLVGRGTRLKGHHYAIRLLADLRQRGVNAALLLLGVIEPGRDSYRAELIALARQLGVFDYVAMSHARRDVREVYAISRVVLQLSEKAESFGRTVIEALSIGIPVAGFAHGGVGELLAELYPAGAVPLGDEQRLLEVVQQLLLESPPVTAPTRYRLDGMQQATLAVYRELLAEPRN